MAGNRQPLSAWRYSGLGMELVGAVAALAAVGYWLDRRFDSSPWGVFVGAGIGIVGGMWNLIRVGLQASREESSETDAEPHA
ncbi:MAG: AtpZ/AtpI family protein [Thermoanaerobaculia bacterium]